MARIMLGLPVGGGFHAPMVESLVAMLSQNPGGHRFDVQILTGESLISRARNKLAALLAESDCDSLMMIDSDLSFPVDGVDRLYQHGKAIVGATYPRKMFPLELLVAAEKDQPPLARGLAKVRYLPTGFLLIRREVFEQLADESLRYIEFLKTYMGFFNPILIRDSEGTPVHLGEDWAFGERARSRGIETYCDFDLQLVHHGRYVYSMRRVEGGYPATEPLFSASQAFRPDRAMQHLEEGLRQYEALHGMVKGLLPT